MYSVARVLFWDKRSAHAKNSTALLLSYGIKILFQLPPTTILYNILQYSSVVTIGLSASILYHLRHLTGVQYGTTDSSLFLLEWFGGGRKNSFLQLLYPTAHRTTTQPGVVVRQQTTQQLTTKQQDVVPAFLSAHCVCNATDTMISLCVMPTVHTASVDTCMPCMCPLISTTPPPYSHRDQCKIIKK